MSEYETIEICPDGPVTVVALNRPDKFNAVNLQMHRELQAALKGITRDRNVRALVLTGNGKGFCAGQDLSEFGSTKGDDFRVDEHVRRTFNRLALTLHQLDRPVICAVNGVAAGAGASLALAADLRICSDRASFLQAFINVGLVPDTGSTWFLPRLVGLPTALELAWTGRKVDAEEAQRIGLANRVVPHDELMTATMELAQRLAAMPTRAIGMTKRAMHRSVDVPLADALEYEAQLQQAASRTSDHREGVTAFLEKREPSFTGS